LTVGAQAEQLEQVTVYLVSGSCFDPFDQRLDVVLAGELDCFATVLADNVVAVSL
jgi:hypothetical protein